MKFLMTLLLFSLLACNADPNGKKLGDLPAPSFVSVSDLEKEQALELQAMIAVNAYLTTPFKFARASQTIKYQENLLEASFTSVNFAIDAYIEKATANKNIYTGTTIDSLKEKAKLLAASIDKKIAFFQQVKTNINNANTGARQGSETLEPLRLLLLDAKYDFTLNTYTFRLGDYFSQKYTISMAMQTSSSYTFLLRDGFYYSAYGNNEIYFPISQYTSLEVIAKKLDSSFSLTLEPIDESSRVNVSSLGQAQLVSEDRSLPAQIYFLPIGAYDPDPALEIERKDQVNPNIIVNTLPIVLDSYFKEKLLTQEKILSLSGGQGTNTGTTLPTLGDSCLRSVNAKVACVISYGTAITKPQNQAQCQQLGGSYQSVPCETQNLKKQCNLSISSTQGALINYYNYFSDEEITADCSALNGTVQEPK